MVKKYYKFLSCFAALRHVEKVYIYIYCKYIARVNYGPKKKKKKRTQTPIFYLRARSFYTFACINKCVRGGAGKMVSEFEAAQEKKKQYTDFANPKNIHTTV